MTNEEAIKILQNDGCCRNCPFGGYPCKLTTKCETYQAIDLAIKALEQQLEYGCNTCEYYPMKDQRPQSEWITKEDVIHLLERWSDGYCYIEIPTDDAIKAIKEFKGGKEE